MLRVLKGASTLWDEESLAKSKDALGIKLISLCQTYKMRCDQSGNYDKREYGIIKKATNGFMNDIHNLSIIIDMIEDIISPKDKRETIIGKNTLCLGVLLESYYTNLRSIFDFIPIIIKICLHEKEKSELPQKDSYNTLLKYVKNDNNKGKIPKELIEEIKKGEKIFNIIKSTRDSIIHKGDEAIIFRDGNEFSFAILKFSSEGQVNLIENILNTEDLKYPIIKYLSKLTNMVIEFLEELADIIYYVWCKKENEDINIWLSALEGICMPKFIGFLGWRNQE